MEFKICNTVYNQHITNTWTSLHVLGVFIPPLHTVTSLLPIVQVFCFQNLLQTSQVWKVRHPNSHSIELSQLSTNHAQTTEIDNVSSHCAAKIHWNEMCINSFSSSCVKCKGSGPTICAICDSSGRFNFAIHGFNGSVDGLFRIAEFVCKQQAWDSIFGHPMTLACTQSYIKIAIINLVAREKTLACSLRAQSHSKESN